MKSTEITSILDLKTIIISVSKLHEVAFIFLSEISP